MTNEQIIFSNRLDLLQKGILQSTGRLIVVEDKEGKKSYKAEPEQIHTYAEWKRRGYTVKHGEKAITSFSIWQRKGGADQSAKMFMKKAYFFKASQVEKSEEVRAV